ncbi:peptidoglycan DD-metalloendopeptidase family protein [Oceanospirillum sp.]|uniref:peptidoglycan DD-metalloendopeptidase family protein n=1 Tax=Oceanospirillum sp. TaxID=2021254 RepID=UPI003A93F3A1
MIFNRVPFFTSLHKVLLVIACLMLALAVIAPSDQTAITLAPVFSVSSDKSVNEPSSPPENKAVLQDETKGQWLVKPGDNLSYIFQENGIPASVLHKVMQADTQYLDLETLQPGVRLGLDLTDNGTLAQLTLYRDPARKITYTRQIDGTYQHQEQQAKTYWVSEVYRGDIQGSFYLSAKGVGLGQSQIALISQLLSYQLNFRRDLRAGDHFTAVIGREMTGQVETGQTRIESVSLQRRQRTHYVFQFKGHYYDEKGESVTPAFLRWPTSKRYRISSSFNKNRLHPITKRRSPHHGVDLATPTGTAILSTGDGVVKRIGNHPFAGKYIDIDHGGSYKTRYLHLSRIQVKRGSQVKRGQRIALSGNTGRSTGAHLHFELHIDGRPVNPVTAKIPTAAAIKPQDIAEFSALREQKMAVMEQAASMSELQTAQNSREF